MGMVKFEESAVAAGSIGDLSPGMAVSAVIHPFHAHDDIHQPLWRATSVLAIQPPHPAPDITAGTGSLILTKKTYGMLRNSHSLKIFVPGWAGVNTPSGTGWQVPQLTPGPLHYLAMPNPKFQYRGEPFALAVHPLRPDCLSSTASPNAVEMEHWAAEADLPFPARLRPNDVPPPSPADPQTLHATLNWTTVRDALSSATLLPLPEFSHILNHAPNLFHWAFFSDLPPQPPEPHSSLPQEIAILSQARLL